MNITEQDVIKTIEALQTAAAACVHPLVQPYAKSLQERAERLRSQQFTVAFFGAFSAGKSSLINALLGEQVLPVSPNPTTAAINRILPPTEQDSEGTIRVILKDRETIMQEVARSAEMLQLPSSFQELASRLEAVDVATLTERLKPHYSYLRGVLRGYADIEQHLGQTITILASELRQMVANEEQAAFVSRVDLYRTSELSKAGVILVDTPGVDSLHARHTDVAFRYMRDADAIVFVTYYNHAFSQSDREFLMQLGRVKEALATDALFFVINAADLSANSEELESVKKHVDSNLAKLGVRLNKLYTVSSQLGLAASLLAQQEQVSPSIERMVRQRLRLSSDSPFPRVEDLRQRAGVEDLRQEITQCTRGRLVAASIEAANQELASVFESIEGYVRTLRGDRVTGLQEFANQKQQADQLQQVFSQDIELDEVALEQEIRELLYHVKQRIRFSHFDLIVQAFHPSFFTRGDDREIQSALEEWVRLLALIVEQEVRATGIRIVRSAKRIVLERSKRVTVAAKAPPLGIVLHLDELPAVPDDFPLQAQFEVPTQVQKLAQKECKNVQQFFEQGGRKRLSDQLEPFATIWVDQYLEQIQQWFVHRQQMWIREAQRALRVSLEKEVTSFLALKRQAIDDESALLSLTETLRVWPKN